MIRILIAAFLALGFATAHAATVTVRYDFPNYANSELMYGYFGGDEPITGQIVSTTLVIQGYTTTAGQDAADFYFGFDVPTYDGEDQMITVNGADIGWTGVGSFEYTFTSEVYNGTIRPGRFAAEFFGGGEFVGESYLEFVVEADPVDPIFDDGFDIL